MASRRPLLRGLWRAASVWDKGGRQVAPAVPIQQHLGAWWRVRAAGIGGLSSSYDCRRLALGQPFWLHTAGMVHENEGDDEGEEKESSRDLRRFSGRGLTREEVQQLLHHVNLTALKHKLEEDSREHMELAELVELCQTEKVAGSADEGAEVVRSLHEAGAIFVFRSRVFLRPGRLAQQIATALPLELALEDDPRKEEFERLEAVKLKLDAMAHKKVRRNLLAGLVIMTAHFSLFFWLTFWQFSWDIMEPIAFFVTTGVLLAGYGYFLTTDSDPSYQDIHERLFEYHQKKLMKKMGFDNQRYQFLARQCKSCFSHAEGHHRLRAKQD